eukprot:6182730-Pleurochrysis_carterae.AAC.3
MTGWASQRLFDAARRGTAGGWWELLDWYVHVCCMRPASNKRTCALSKGGLSEPCCCRYAIEFSCKRSPCFTEGPTGMPRFEKPLASLPNRFLNFAFSKTCSPEYTAAELMLMLGLGNVPVPASAVAAAESSMASLDVGIARAARMESRRTA